MSQILQYLSNIRNEFKCKIKACRITRNEQVTFCSFIYENCHYIPVKIGNNFIYISTKCQATAHCICRFEFNLILCKRC